MQQMPYCHVFHNLLKRAVGKRQGALSEAFVKKK